MANNYINNKEFLEALLDYQKVCSISKKEDKKNPPIPNYIGECFLMIAERLSRKPNFASYSFREEMVGDGVENCICYFRNFDPEKSSNPFAYFTQIIYFAFLRRINKEKKELYVKYKSTEQLGILDEGQTLMGEDGHTKQFEMYSNITDFINAFEDAKKKKKVNKVSGLERFVEEDGDTLDDLNISEEIILGNILNLEDELNNE